MRELIAQLNELEDSMIRIESEHKSAVSKIILLKDIIAEREQPSAGQEKSGRSGTGTGDVEIPPGQWPDERHDYRSAGRVEKTPDQFGAVWRKLVGAKTDEDVVARDAGSSGQTNEGAGSDACLWIEFKLESAE